MNFPLFPLNTVLFPGCILDLQIFEPRYLDMISRCMKRDEGFGVVGIIDGEEVGETVSRFAALGCEARIRDFQQRPNGLLGIRVEGGRCFHVDKAVVQSDQLVLAEVSWFDEPRDVPLLAEHVDLAALLAALAEHPLVVGLGMSGVVNGQQALANQLAYLLPFSIEDKLQALVLGDPSQRLGHIQNLLDQLQGELTA